MTVPTPEVWQRGAVPGYDPYLMPVVHALLQAREDLARLATQVPSAHVWARPGGAASIGFHVRHVGGALERLLTYARGESLSDAQRASARDEGMPGGSPADMSVLVTRVHQQIDSALEQVRTTPRHHVLDDRTVGRAGLPSNVLGLLFHAAEHATRHVGQAITTAKILAGGVTPDGGA